MRDLFGYFCYIDTPGIAGKKTRYRIIANGRISNCWTEVPVKGKAEAVKHDHFEEIVIVVLDTLVNDDSALQRFALKDIEVIEPEPPERKTGKWIQRRHPNWEIEVLYCSECGWLNGNEYSNYCPNCGSYNGGGEE